MKFKGKFFKSFENPPSPVFSLKEKKQPTSRALPLGMTWNGHDGKKARIRRLRQMYGKLLKSKDPQIKALVDAIKMNTQDELEILLTLASATVAANNTELTMELQVEEPKDSLTVKEVE